MKSPFVFCFSLVLLSSALGTEPVPYDPLVVAETKIVTETLEVKDAARNRVLPLRGAPATNVAPSRSSTSIMSPQLSRTVRPRIAYHRPKPS